MCSTQRSVVNPRVGWFAATCILFGDGCGAVVMTSQPGTCSLLGSAMHSDGNGQKHLKARLGTPSSCAPQAPPQLQRISTSEGGGGGGVFGLVSNEWEHHLTLWYST
jgi:3-oxoacyl-[acyl-carrier-protein] synthase III